jgi:hypothetical protein
MVKISGNINSLFLIPFFSILALSPVKNFRPGLTTIFSMTLKKG